MRRLIRDGWLRAADPDVLGIAFMSPLLMWRQLHAIDADLPMVHEPAGVRPPARRAVPARRLGRRSQAQRRPAAPSRAAPGERRRAARVNRLTIMELRPCLASCVLSIIVLCRGTARQSRAPRQRRGGGAPPRPRPSGDRRHGRSTSPSPGYISVSGTLTAEEDADVAAEIAGRVVATPVERGSRVAADGDLVRIAATEVEAQAREAQANAAQIEARLGIANGAAFDVERVPEVANAKAAHRPGPHRLRARRDAAEAAAALAVRVRPASAPRSRRPSVSTTSPRNGAEQQYQSLMAARARTRVAQKALADTVVRAPFAGVVGERFVSVGDYVTRGTKVASVMRVDPLRVELTVPEQDVVGGRPPAAPSPSRLTRIPARPFTGQVRYVSPSVNADTRALTIEAVVPNPDRPPEARVLRHRPHRAGGDSRRGMLVPAAAVRTVAGTARVFVVAADRAEERIVMTGQAVGERIEITTGLKAGERVVDRWRGAAGRRRPRRRRGNRPCSGWLRSASAARSSRGCSCSR